MTRQELINKIEKELKEVSEKRVDDSKYPMYFKNSNGTDWVVVEYDGLHTGKVVLTSPTHYYEVGGYCNNWEPIKNPDVWKQVNLIDVIPDKALVWCWDDDQLFYKEIRFFDAKNKATFNRHAGNRIGPSFKNYEIYIGKQPKWAIEDRKMLKD
jgi:hypothetical protein